MDISLQLRVHPATPIMRPTPKILERRNRGYLLLLLLIPIVVILNLAFWTGFVPSMAHTANETRNRRLTVNQRAIEQALTACHSDTGGVPVTDLAMLQQFGITAGDLTPGARLHQWKGPYLPSGQPFPVNPYRPNDGAAGWRYEVHGDTGTISPAHYAP